MNQENNKNGKLLDWTLVLSSIVCLLPLLFSAVVYQNLPEQLAIHWNNAGVADGFLPKLWARSACRFSCWRST